MKINIYENSDTYTLFELNDYGQYVYSVSFRTLNDYFEYMIMNDLYVSCGHIYKIEKKSTADEHNTIHVKSIKHTYILTKNDLMIDSDAIIKSVKDTSSHILNMKLSKLNKNANHQFRYDPVPGIRCHRRAYFRKIQNWFHNYRLIYVPEYRQYTRIRTAPDDPYDAEKPKPIYRSWKHNTKKKHQWE